MAADAAHYYFLLWRHCLRKIKFYLKTNSNFLAVLISEIKRVSKNLMWGQPTTPLPYPVRWNFCVCSKYLARSNSVPNFSIVSVCIMQLCEYVVPIGLPLCVPKNGGFRGFEGEDVKYCVLTPNRHYPAWICVCWCIACQNRFNGLSSRSVQRFCVQRRKKEKMSGNFGYMGRSNLWDDLDHMWRVGRYGGRNHVCNIWWLSVKGCGCGERGKLSLPSPVDLTRRPYNTGHTNVWPCDTC